MSACDAVANGDAVEVFNGANDNASGVAGVLEIAEAMTKLPQAPRRSVLFALWDGEERGFVGSQFFVGQSERQIRTDYGRDRRRYDWSSGRQSADRVGHGHRTPLARHSDRRQRRAPTETRPAAVHAGVVGPPTFLFTRHARRARLHRACSPSCIARPTTWNSSIPTACAAPRRCCRV